MSSKVYKVAPGHSMRADDGTLRTGGQDIEVADDSAADHLLAGRIEPLAEDQAAPAAGEYGE